MLHSSLNMRYHFSIHMYIYIYIEYSVFIFASLFDSSLSTPPISPNQYPFDVYITSLYSGKVVITGAKSQSDLRTGFDSLYYVLFEHRKEVLSSQPKTTSNRLT